MTSFYFACAHDNRHVVMPRQNIQLQFVFGVFCPSRALMGASPSRISLSKIAFRDPKFEFFARRRPTMVGGRRGRLWRPPKLAIPPPLYQFFSVARSARDNFHDFENSCEMPTLYRSHRHASDARVPIDRSRDVGHGYVFKLSAS